MAKEFMSMDEYAASLVGARVGSKLAGGAKAGPGSLVAASAGATAGRKILGKKPKGMAKGGKVQKMAGGGMMKKKGYAKGGKVKKMAGGGMMKKGYAKGGKVK